MLRNSDSEKEFCTPISIGEVSESVDFSNKLAKETRDLILSELIASSNISKEEVDNMSFPVYMDYQATTVVDPRVLESMIPFFSTFVNSHSRSHEFGWGAEKAVDIARKQVASLIGADSKEIVFTSGATEACNMAIKGVVDFYCDSSLDVKKNIITTKIEHKAVLDTFRNIELSGLAECRYLEVDKEGFVDIEKLSSMIDENTILVSIMTANNEIGTIQDVKKIGALCKDRGVFFHTDAAQAFGKIKLDVNEYNIDLMSISGHKIYGPMGIGALYIRRKKPRVRIKPIIHGGGQESGFRPGTLPTALAVGLGKAAEIAETEMDLESKRVIELRNLLYEKIKKSVPYVVINGPDIYCDKRLSNNLNITFPYVEGESIMMAIKDVAVSSGSACTSASLEPSYVLRALDISDDLAHSSIRFSVGRYTTKADVLYVAALVAKKINKLLEMSPLYEMVQEGIDLNTVEWTGH